MTCIRKHVLTKEEQLLADEMQRTGETAVKNTKGQMASPIVIVKYGMVLLLALWIFSEIIPSIDKTNMSEEAQKTANDTETKVYTAIKISVVGMIMYAAGSAIKSFGWFGE